MLLNRHFIAVAAVFLYAATAAAATVSGTVALVQRRGQKVVIAESLVWLEPESAAEPRKPETVQMLTRGKTLLPHVLAVPVGSTVFFPNDDPITHNLFSATEPNSFDLGLYRRGAGKSERFDHPGVVNVYCNVHPNMSGVVHVMKTPWYAFAGPSGEFSIQDVPPGRYRLVAWHEAAGTSSSAIAVGAAGAVSGTTRLVLDSRNTRIAPHNDKRGRPYKHNRAKDY